MQQASLEAWIWYPIVICTVIGRYISQWMSQKGASGLNRFRLDDYVMLFSTCTYTVVIVTLYKIQIYSDPAVMAAATEDPDAYEPYIHLVVNLILVNETITQATLWCNKLCMLLVYNKFTRVTSRDRLFQVSVGILAFSFVLIITLLYTQCQPFSENYDIDGNSFECYTWFRYYVVQAIVNIGSDIYIMVLFWIMLAGLSLPPLKKILLFCIFSLGLFMIVSALLTKITVLKDPFAHEWMVWYVRELSVVMLIGNLTVCFPLLLTIFRYCRSSIPTNLMYLREKTMSLARGTIGTQTTEKQSSMDAAEPHSQV